MYLLDFYQAPDLPIDHLTATSTPPSPTCEAAEAENIYVEGAINFDKGEGEEIVLYLTSPNGLGSGSSRWCVNKCSWQLTRIKRHEILEYYINTCK